MGTNFPDWLVKRYGLIKKQKIFFTYAHSTDVNEAF